MGFDRGYISDSSPEAFNVNLEYIKSIYLLYMDFIRASQTVEFDQMYRILRSMILSSSIKVQTTDLRTRLNNLREVKDSWIVNKNEQGQPTRINSKRRDEIDDEFYNITETLLQRLADKGILIKQKDDPSHAMAKFDS